MPDFRCLPHLPRCLVVCLIFLHGCAQDRPATEGDAVASPPRVSFSLLPADSTGIDFSNRLPEDYYRNILRYQYYYNGGGVALADFNGDELLDVCFSGNLQPPQLYFNRGGWRFTKATNAGLALPGRASWATGISTADVNGDGHVDLYLCRSGNLREENRRNLLYLNDGQGGFTEQAARYGLDDPGYGMQAAWFDYDKDGDLDVYLANHAVNFYGKRPRGGLGKTDAYAGDKLYRNDGGRFVNVTEAAGMLEAADSYGLGIAVGDLNGDGWDDVYVSNDYHVPDYCYLNQGDGTFRSGGAEVTPQTSFFSMGNDLADLNNDTLPDLIVADMTPEDHRRRLTNVGGVSYEEHRGNLRGGNPHQFMFNTVQLNNGNGTFSNVAALTGMQQTDWSWAPLIADLDNDGWQDVYVTNGIRKDVLNLDFINYVSPRYTRFTDASGQLPEARFRQLLAELPANKIPNYAFRNEGGLRFTNSTEDWGLKQPGWSNGAAYGDLDNDGDLDLVVNNIDQAAFVYRNEQRGHGAIRLRLNGPARNTAGLGAKIYVTTPAGVQYRQAYFNRGFLSAVEPTVHVGVGDAAAATVRVVWPDGRAQTLTATTGSVLTVDYREATLPGPSAGDRPPPLFELDAKGPAIAHRENAHDDFKKYFLLPRKLSAEGPYLSVNAAERPETQVYAGGSAGTPGRLWVRDTEGNWSEQGGPWEADRAAEDAGSAWLDVDGDGDSDLYVASGGAEFPPGDGRYQDRLYRREADGSFRKADLPALPFSASVVRPGDYDGDGDTDLLVGGRLRPGNYPLAGTSVLLRNDGGRFERVALPSEGQWGMVNDLRWLDYDGDGKLDILAVGEWMPPRFFRNLGGSFRETSEEIGLPDLTGWYFSITTGDFDADGDDDLILGNLGLNHRYRASGSAPFGILAGDYDDNGSLDPLMGPTIEGRLVPLHGRQVLRDQINFIAKDFPSYAAYSEASLADIVKNRRGRTQFAAEATNFASLYLENGGGGAFRHRPLPRLAQLSTVRAGLARDFDADGDLDVLLAGNTFGMEYRTPRSDASTGLLLLNDGEGNFTAQTGEKTGFRATGNVRGIYSLGPGSRSLLVARNDGPLTTYRW